MSFYKKCIPILEYKINKYIDRTGDSRKTN